jgi:SAM-dependent methyltransferase
MSIKYEALRQALDYDRATQRVESGNHYFADIIQVQEGSFLGRNLDQYQEILGHGGAPDIIDHLSNLPRGGVVIDVGCGAGIALSQMRQYREDLRLIGIDTRDVTRNTISNLGLKVGSKFAQNQVEFYQDSQRNLGRIPEIPAQIDLITCVGAAYDHHNRTSMLLPFTLKRFSKALSSKGMAQIFVSTSRDHFNYTREVLDCYQINHHFYPANSRILRQNSFSSAEGVAGTIVLYK